MLMAIAFGSLRLALIAKPSIAVPRWFFNIIGGRPIGTIAAKVPNIFVLSFTIITHMIIPPPHIIAFLCNITKMAKSTAFELNLLIR
jgi:hypothetical protein